MLPHIPAKWDCQLTLVRNENRPGQAVLFVVAELLDVGTGRQGEGLAADIAHGVAARRFLEKGALSLARAVLMSVGRASASVVRFDTQIEDLMQRELQPLFVELPTEVEPLFPCNCLQCLARPRDTTRGVDQVRRAVKGMYADCSDWLVCRSEMFGDVERQAYVDTESNYGHLTQHEVIDGLLTTLAQPTYLLRQSR